MITVFASCSNMCNICSLPFQVSFGSLLGEKASLTGTQHHVFLPYSVSSLNMKTETVFFPWQGARGKTEFAFVFLFPIKPICCITLVLLQVLL